MAGGSEIGGDAGVSRPPPRDRHHEEEMPRVRLTRRQVVVLTIFLLSAIGFLYFVLPKLTSAGETVNRIERGDKWWIAVGVVFEVLSFGGYIVLFRTVFVKRPHPQSHLDRLNWRVTYEITMAGLAATRLFAAAGAGGIALTAWALRRSGMEPRLVGCRLVAFNVILYTVYAGSMLIDGLGLGLGLFPGGGSFAITFVPAIVAAVLFCAAAGIAALPGDVERRFGARAAGGGRWARFYARAATVPGLVASGVRTAWDVVRAKDWGVLGALAWWGFDISVLWAMFHAFGEPPPFTVIWMAYFVGTLGNLLPVPGGIGGVEGGMIGAFAAFGVNLELATLAVLSYRAISFWLPTFPGAVAYFQLRRTVGRWRSEELADMLTPSDQAGSAAAAEAV
jgi:putative heme transporter